nr:vegetative incompatibility protein het-e-1 [Quercus suber]
MGRGEGPGRTKRQPAGVVAGKKEGINIDVCSYIPGYDRRSSYLASVFAFLSTNLHLFLSDSLRCIESTNGDGTSTICAVDAAGCELSVCFRMVRQSPSGSSSKQREAVRTRIVKSSALVNPGCPMYLLRFDERGKLSHVRHNTDDVPPYAILSHTWGPDADELTFKDIMADCGQDKAGFAKVRFCGEQAKKHGLQYFWVDSCCINRDSSSELSEAIISMFRWYKRASRCYVYLEDVSTRKRNHSGQTEGTWEVAFQKSRWFTRGWTLQELLAPKIVEFFSRDQHLLGDKVMLEGLINTTTGIPIEALRGEPLSGFTVEERLRWVAARQTQREEDKAYCLMGIFNVLISPLYGERENAFYRLREAIERRRSQHQSASIVRRLPAAEDSGHRSIVTARRANLEENRDALIASLEFEQMDTRRSTIKDAHSTTCQWLLLHDAYIAWDNPTKLPREHDILWLNGKPGTGKSTMIKWAFSYTKKKVRKRKDEILLSFFFNARGDELEKTTVGMYRSLLHQLFKDAPDLQSILDEIDTEALESGMPSFWTLEVLKGLFTAAVAGLGRRRLKCFIDALDECDEQQIRDMVMMFEDVSDSALEGGTKLCICFASRHYPEIRIKKGLSIILENEDGHSKDLKHFIQRQLAAGDGENDERIRRRIQEKSNGVFMWAVLVIDILNPEYRVGRMWNIEKKLEEMPEKLSELFKTILRRDNTNMDDLLLCLQWILFSKRPLRAEEFYFAMAAKLDQAQPGPWNRETVTNEHMARFVVGSSKGLAELTKSVETPTVQFIHESVRDYLIKDGGLCELWPHINGSLISSSHDQLKQSCENYLTVDLSGHIPPAQDLPKASSPAGKTLREDVAGKFPFIHYASKQVFYHANQAAEDIPQREFLEKFALDEWLYITNVLQRYDSHRHTSNATLLYVLAESNCARLIALTPTHRRWDRVPGERYGYPFLAAFSHGSQDALSALMNEDGYTSLVQELAEDVGFGRGYKLRTTESRLFWALKHHNWALAEFLGTFNHESGSSSLPLMLDRDRVQDILRFVAQGGLTTIFRRLMELWPNVTESPDHRDGSMLYVAAKNNRGTMVQMLLAEGADVNARGGFQTALYTATERGHEKVVQMLLAAGADVNARGGHWGSALRAASQDGYEKVVQMLLDAGADVNAQGRCFGSALYAASQGGYEKVVQMLLATGANVNAQGGYHGNALQAASQYRHNKVVQMLLEAGAVLHPRPPL